MTGHVADLITVVAYFSIPIQLLFSLWRYPRLAKMPPTIVVLVVLFALFIFLCGTGHLLRYMDDGTTVFSIINSLTAAISIITAIYLLPLAPRLMGSLDESLQDLEKRNQQIADSRTKLFSFMAFLCHEIRNPLFAITSSATFLGDTEMTEEQQVGVGSIFDSSLLMLRLVNDVLDLSKIDAGKMELEERDFDLHRLLENLEANMRMQIMDKHNGKVQFDFRMAPDVPRIVHGDSIRMLQIIYNLLSNSSKFTYEGHIDLSVSVLDESLPEEHKQAAHHKASALSSSMVGITDKLGTVFSMSALEEMEEGQTSHGDEKKTVVLSIVVLDTGTGIEPERIDTIFEPYSQAKLSDYRKQGGTGLGLSIVSSMIRRMGGSVEVKSKIGEGSQFFVRLPVQLAYEQEQDIIDDTDMTDPLLSARRLPVYTKNQDDIDVPTKSKSIKCLHSDDAGVQFFTPHRRSRRNSYTNVRIKKDTQKPNQMSKFNLPSGSGVVLVVDDNCVNRKIIGKMLAFFNVEFREAVNGLEAVNMIKNSRNAGDDPNALHFGLIFMDLSMPIMDGYEAIESIRNDGIKVPIIALTANALSKERVRALEVGADEFHTKPILRKDMHAICVRYLGSPDSPCDATTETTQESGLSQDGPPTEQRQVAARTQSIGSLGDVYREGHFFAPPSA